MSFDWSVIKRVVLAAVAAAVLALAVNAGYGLAFSASQGAPLPEAPYLILGLFLVAVGAIVGVRLAAGRGPHSRWAGLVAGAGLALVVVAAALVRGGLDFWLPPNAFMAVVGGGLGTWLAGRRPE
ncbi:MAG: hypothetical protein JXA93_13090 [Anaerolineae bacterium]|nr:hypothetical protein [Anaerolineae bacterium]